MTNPLERIGLQLYTVRAEMEKDVDATLERVAHIGYREVEFAGYFGRSPKELKATLDRLGLAAPSAHATVALLRDDLSQVIDCAHQLGHRYVVNGWVDDEFRGSLAGWRKL